MKAMTSRRLKMVLRSVFTTTNYTAKCRLAAGMPIKVKSPSMKQLNKKEIRKLRKTTPKRGQEIYLILENVEYPRNVATIFRTAEAAGVRRLYLTGISHTPPFGKDLAKASRSSEEHVEWKYAQETSKVMNSLKKDGFHFIAIEITDSGIPVTDFAREALRHRKICFVAGSEVYGIKKSTLAACHNSVYIPIYGKNASLNVAASVAVVLFSW
jgi:23S rRNA (guanosine2251-2'-O)-methyltransferase